ncbi:MAG: ROK family protein [Microbacterium sp.]|nr:ROK family protein [Microbacterium sp.]
MGVAMAVDVGGTKAEAALVRDDGSIVEGTRARVPTGASEDAATLRGAIDELVRTCAASPEWAEVTAAGIGSAGPVDLPSGAISPINMTNVRDFGIVDAIRASSGLADVVLRLDGTCIALAELWLGAARGIRNAIVIVVSTGVGGGIVSDGRLVAGRSGNAGHVGQVVIQQVEASPAAATVEGIASGPHTVAWAQERGWPGVTGEDLAAAYRAGDPVATAAVARSAGAVGVGLLDAATLLDLELAVIGGGFSFVADDYPAQVEAAIRAAAVNGYAGRMRVVRAELGGDAPLVGAAALVHRRDLLG